MPVKDLEAKNVKEVSCEIEKISSDKEYQHLLQQIMERLQAGLDKAVDKVRRAQLATYWDNGQYIVE